MDRQTSIDSQSHSVTRVLKPLKATTMIEEVARLPQQDQADDGHPGDLLFEQREQDSGREQVL